MKTVLKLVTVCFTVSLGFSQGYVENQKLAALDRNTSGFYGSSVHLMNQYLVVGATGNDSLSSSSGAAYIYEKVNSQWVLDTMLKPSGLSFNDQMGNDITSAGNSLLIASYFNDEGPIPANGGSVYHYENVGGTWTYQNNFSADDILATDLFGTSISASGDYLVVGSPRHDYDLNVENFISESGAVYIFKKDGTNQYQQIAKLISPTRSFEERFGISVAINGNDLLIGARGDDEDAMEMGFLDDAGSVYYYQNDGADNFNLIEKIVASDRGTINSFFGDHIHLDGNRLFIKGITQNLRGGVYYFEKNGNSWTEEQLIESNSNSAAVRDSYGADMATENTRLIIGSRNEENLFATVTGVCYYFEFDGLDWVEQQQFFSGDAASSDLFGNSVDILNDEVVAGASQHSNDEMNMNPISSAGATYTFDFDPDWTLAVGEENLTEIKIFPNPTQEVVQFDLGQDVYGNISAKLYSVNGQLILSKRFQDRYGSLRIEGASGIYFLHLESDSFKEIIKILKY